MAGEAGEHAWAFSRPRCLGRRSAFGIPRPCQERRERRHTTHGQTAPGTTGPLSRTGRGPVRHRSGCGVRSSKIWGRIARLQREATELGLDPNVWFRNVENVVARRLGHETVQYVSNIYKYFIAYRLIADTIALRGQADGLVGPARP